MPSSAPPPSPDLARSADVRRDNDHYHPTGDSIIRVENTLFKIHRFPFLRHSPVFATMFDLPIGAGVPEGASDDFPIVLAGETASDFRAVIKYMYASPMQLQIGSIPVTALLEVIAVAKFSHKYAMDQWKEWAGTIIGRYMADLKALPAEHIPSLYALFSSLGVKRSARTLLMERWCEIVERQNDPIGQILIAADAARDTDGLVAIYCIQIRRWEKAASISAPEDGVDPTHFQRILSGHASLTLAWNRLRTHEPPSRFQDARCNGGGSPKFHTERCLPYSRILWVAATVDAERCYPHITQIVSRISHLGKHIQQNVGVHPSDADATTVTCFNAVIKRFHQINMQEAHKSLASHFFPSLT
ncbi:BTB domain-containing protein [Mycena sanguinolenta]|uniref:BTB domain-containing protein n=1 Tax=Mycena sanguinolenta TaxID=230812 RepID=A0A8H6XUQ2_9AGAR|nr:BTB domain-containing protein [Mycena sanguinolenta]